ncbi:MAG: magnesium transporter, partial [Aquificae bacterium]|nr:magnesium transporter [Aquificota bacterium]
RLPWILVSVFGELVSAFIISKFDFTIKQYLPIIFFLPLVAAVSGNISSQSAIITARGLLTGKITQNLKDYMYLLFREIKIAFILGIIISTIVGIISFLWLSTHIIGVVVATSLFINIIIAAFLGGLLPFILVKLGKDPTLATGPITLTLNDVIGILIYLGTATAFLHYINI